MYVLCIMYYVWMYGCMDGWMYACMDAWMYARMDAWMHGCIVLYCLVLYCMYYIPVATL